MDQNIKLKFKSDIYTQFARMGKALGNARRLEILDLLTQAEHTVELLASKTSLSIASVSQHLQILKAAHLVEVRREGTYAFYSVANEQVSRAWMAMNELAQGRLLEVERLIENMPSQHLPSISIPELLSKLENADLILLDARPLEEYQAGHIPHAQSLPIEALDENLLTQLPKDREIIAYCRNAYCLLSDELALTLTEKGYQVRVLEKGMLDWQLAGLPVEGP